MDAVREELLGLVIATYGPHEAPPGVVCTEVHIRRGNAMSKSTPELSMPVDAEARSQCAVLAGGAWWGPRATASGVLRCWQGRPGHGLESVEVGPTIIALTSAETYEPGVRKAISTIKEHDGSKYPWVAVQ